MGERVEINQAAPPPTPSSPRPPRHPPAPPSRTPHSCALRRSRSSRRVGCGCRLGFCWVFRRARLRTRCRLWAKIPLRRVRSSVS
jgi:hypothetical protein